MSFKDQFSKVCRAGGSAGRPEQDRALATDRERNSEPETDELDEALRNFCLSVHAWSEAAYSRPRAAVAHRRRRAWRLAAGWALGCVLIAGGASAGFWEHHQQGLKITAARVAGQHQMAAQERAKQERKTEEDLLAKVDSDVSQEVPDAMEPLAQLMAGDETQ